MTGDWWLSSFQQVWDEITILEEAESGNQVTSVIRVPAQVFNMHFYSMGNFVM